MADTALQPEVKKLNDEMVVLVSQVEALIIDGQTSYNQAGEYVIVLKKGIKDIEQKFETPVKKANEAHKALTKWRTDELEKRKKPLGIIRIKMLAWDNKMEALRQEEQRKQDEIQRKAAEDAQLREAEALEKEGRTDEAEAELDRPLETIAVVVPKKLEAVKGMRKVTKWKARLKKERGSRGEFLKAVANNPAYHEFVIDDISKLNGMARAMKQGFNIPGYDAYEDTQLY